MHPLASEDDHAYLLEDSGVKTLFVDPEAFAQHVFTTEPDHLWSAVLRRKGGAFAVLALMPPNPSRN